MHPSHPLHPWRLWAGHLIDEMQAADLNTYEDRVRLKPMYRKAPAEAVVLSDRDCDLLLTGGRGNYTGD